MYLIIAGVTPWWQNKLDLFSGRRGLQKRQHWRNTRGKGNIREKKKKLFPLGARRMVLGFRWLPFAHAKGGGRLRSGSYIVARHCGASLQRFGRATGAGRFRGGKKNGIRVCASIPSVLYGDLLTLPGRRTPVYTHIYIYMYDGAFLI